MSTFINNKQQFHSSMNMWIVCTYEIDVLYTYKRKGKISHGLPLVSSLRIFNHYIASHIFFERAEFEH